jgi:hypothetical protein
MNMLNDLGWFFLDLPIHLANGILLTLYWLLANLPALASIGAAYLISSIPDRLVQDRTGRPLRSERAGDLQGPKTTQGMTGLVLLLWIAGQWGMAAPVPWIGAAMWLVGGIAVIIMQNQQFNLLWFMKTGIAIYALAVIASRLYLAYTIQLTPEQWAALIGSSQSAATVIANTRGNMTTIILWALWLVIPLGYFSMLLQQVFLNPVSVMNPVGGVQKTLEALRYRGGR